MSETLTIRSSVNGSYTVSFIDDLRAQIAQDLESQTCIFIIDEAVLSLFGAELSAAVAKGRYVLVDAREENKTMDYAQNVIRKLLDHNVRKNDTLIAIGGGITQDIVAFISSVLFRGVEWQFYPTTLLAQCDSCIGSKSSINFDQYKNLIGTFNPPSRIFIYKKFLDTLTESEIKSGIGEMLHYFLTEGIELAQQISDQYDELLSNRSKLSSFISNSLRIKKNIIEKDEFDTSIRHIFNYGHTFGHAIEAITKYAIPHGQAVSIGMDLANYISLKKGILGAEDFDEMHGILDKNIPPFKFNPSNIEPYCIALSRDKKNKGNQLGSILSYGPGNVKKVFIDIDQNLKDIFLEYSNKFGKEA